MNKIKAKENTEHESRNKREGGEGRTIRFSFQKEAFKKTQNVKRENIKTRKVTTSKIAKFCPVMDVCEIPIPLI